MKKQNLIMSVLVLLIGIKGQAGADKPVMIDELQNQNAITVQGATGFLQVIGDMAPMQLFSRVKAVRCQMDNPARVMIQKGACRETVFFDLNEKATVPVGFYLLGYENSLYPGLVEVKEGVNTEVRLERVEIPASVGAKSVRVVRDFTSSVEQKKMYATVFGLKKPFFALAPYKFGDYYLAAKPKWDWTGRFTYSFCERKSSEMAKEADDVCQSWKKEDFMGLMDLFTFNNQASFTENWVDTPGNIYPLDHARYAVALPAPAGSSVFVFPGVYALVSGDKVIQKSIVAGTVNESYGVVPSLAKRMTSDQAQACLNAKIWRTQSRSYCESEKTEGCELRGATWCEVIK